MLRISRSMLSVGHRQEINDSLRTKLDDAAASDTCDSDDALLDLAALSEGSLSASGVRRLAAHTSQCRSCRALLACLVRRPRPVRTPVRFDSRDNATRIAGLSGESSPSSQFVIPATHRPTIPVTCHVYLSDREPVVARRRHVVLFVAGDAGATSRAALELHCSEIRRALRRMPHGEDLQLEARWAMNGDDLLRQLKEVDPSIVHVVGDGRHGHRVPQHPGKPSQAQLAWQLASSLRSIPQPSMVVLNGCHSVEFRDALRGAATCVVGMPGEIGERDARSFAVNLYGALASRQSVGAAIEHAVAKLNIARRVDMLLPICWTRDDVERLTFPVHQVRPRPHLVRA